VRSRHDTAASPRAPCSAAPSVALAAAMVLAIAASGCRASAPAAEAAVAKRPLHHVLRLGDALPPVRRAAGPGSSHVSVNGCRSEADALPFASLKANPLTSESFRNDPALADAVCSTKVQSFMIYLTRCALPEGDKLRITTPDGDELEYSGGLGLAPEWKTGPCERDCQEWVSACMYAHRNYYGVHVLIWIEAAPIADEPGIEEFPIEEGAYYGNYFLGYRTGYACRGRNFDPMSALWRRCALPGNDCADIMAVGPCSREDGYYGVMTSRFACEGRDPDSSYRNCHTKVSNEDGTFPTDSLLFPHAITFHLRQPNVNPDCP
jgi:hypothetical protein